MKKGRVLKGSVPTEIYVFAALMLISFSLLLFSTRSLMMNIQDAGLSVFSGVRGRVDDLSSLISQVFISVQELARLKTENDELRDRLARFERLERSAAEINQENLRLKEQLGFSESLNYQHIPAKIIGKDPDNLYSALVINKGRHSGVEKDMAVIAWQGGSQALVGKVIHARTFESLVMPIYDTSLLIAARFSASRYEGLVEGQGDPEAALRMRLIPKRARDEINYGDLVVSSGMGGIYPPGLNIGRVSGVSYREYEISMEVELAPLIDFSRLEFVIVIKEKANIEENDTPGISQVLGIKEEAGND